MNPITLFVCAENSDPKNSVAGTRATEGKLPTTRFPPGGHVFGLGLHELGPVEGRTVASIAERGGGNVRTTPVPILLSAGRLCRHKLLCRLVQLAMRKVKGNGYLPKKGANPLHPSSSR